MRKKFFSISGILLIPLLLSPFLLYSKKKTELPPKYKKWIEEEVVYIITPKEREVFYQLETDAQRDRFIKEFWRQRDPTPGTPRNEFKMEHYRRIEYANKWFGRGTSIPGWKTDRGRVYIILGEPIFRQTFSDPRIYPVELWFYQGGKDLAPFFYVIFYKRFWTGNYVLYSPLRDGPKSLLPETSHEASLGDPWYRTRWALTLLSMVSYELTEAAQSLIPGDSGRHPLESDKLLSQIEIYPQEKVDDGYAYEFLKHKGLVEVSYSVHYIGNKNLIKTYCDENGVFFIHYAIQPDSLSVDAYKNKYYSNIKISVRVTDLRGRTVFQYNKFYPIELTKKEIKYAKLRPMNIEDSFPLIPGNYKFNLLFENLVSKEFTSFEREITVPEPLDTPQMSSLLLAYKISEDQEPLRRAFKIENIRIYLSIDNKFHRKET